MSKARQLADLGNVYDDGALSNRNLLINSAMQVAQRGTSVTGITSTGYKTCDRIKTSMLLNGAGTWTQTQEIDGPAGFSNSFKMECTTANASLGATAYLIITQYIEAQNLQHLNYGSSSAKTLTLSFWVKSNKTGTYNLETTNSDASSLYYNINQYTVDTAGTWEYKTITISGSTSDAIDNNNDRGLSINFWLLAGTDYSGGTYSADTWHGTEADRAAGNVNLADTVGNYWQITGVQLEVGDTATPFEHRSYGDELARCQRYFQALEAQSAGIRISQGGWTATTIFECFLPVFTHFRASPSVTISSGWSVTDNGTANGFSTSTFTTTLNAAGGAIAVRGAFGTSSAVAAAGAEGQLRATASNSYVHMDAEL